MMQSMMKGNCMNRTEKYAHYREQCSETKLIDLLDMQDKKIDLLMQRVETIAEQLTEMSTSLYHIAKYDDTATYNLEHLFKESLKAFDDLVGCFDECDN